MPRCKFVDCLFVGKQRAEANQKLQPFFPPLEPLQSTNLRAALLRCLNALKKNGVLGGKVYIRKSMLDDCKGDMVEKLLSEFSTAVLRKALNTEEAGKKSIVERLCTDMQMRAEAHTSLLPLTITHRASLTRKMEAKRSLKARYKMFGNALQCKDSELVNKFGKVVETQNFLDQNPPSESTVERVSKVLDQYWQGDRGQIDIIAQGEEHRLADTLLDQKFEAVWHIVGNGSFNGNISTSRHGTLEDLEQRVAVQKARLERWKDYKSTMEQKEQPRREKLATTSSIRQAFASPHDHRYEQRKGKDSVFSPRKSPRKSIRPTPNYNGMKTTEDADFQFSAEKPDFPGPSPTAYELDDVNSSPLAKKSAISLEPGKHDSLSIDDVGGDVSDPGLSTRLTSTNTGESLRAAVGECQPSSSSKDDSRVPGIHDDPLRETLRIGESTIVSNKESAQPGTSDQNSVTASESVDNDDTIIHPSEPQVLRTTEINTVTPKPKPSLVERTRQSMAYTTPKGVILPDESHHPSPQSEMPSRPTSEEFSIKGTLAERTRQSISQLPTTKSKPLGRRASSKIYPTNQFETPRRQQTIQEVTPPEELMSPGAGYDSVFKSRPKVAFSPTTSPVPFPCSEGVTEISNE